MGCAEILVELEGVGEVKDGSWPRRLSSDEPEPPAADMTRSAFGSVAGGQKEEGEIDHMTTCVLFYFIRESSENPTNPELCMGGSDSCLYTQRPPETPSILYRLLPL